MSDRQSQDMPKLSQLEAEIARTEANRKRRSVLASTIYALVTVAAITVLVATLLLPVLRIYGTSMTPTLAQGDVVVSVKGSNFEQGDIVAFYYNNKILVKRVIAYGGDWVDIDQDGNVTVNGEPLDEPYLEDSARALGQCDIDLPYQVPAGRIFVMGDHRATSVDSRSTEIGCVSEEQLIGRVILRIWPLPVFGTVD